MNLGRTNFGQVMNHTGHTEFFRNACNAIWVNGLTNRFRAWARFFAWLSLN